MKVYVVQIGYTAKINYGNYNILIKMVILLFTSWWNLSFTFCDFYTYVSWIKFFFPIETLKVLVYIWYCSNLKCLATNESISIIGSFLITTVPIFSTLIFKDNKGIMYLQTSFVYFPSWNVVLIGFSKFLATVLITCFYFLNFCFTLPKSSTSFNRKWDSLSLLCLYC